MTDLKFNLFGNYSATTSQRQEEKQKN